MDDKPVAFEAYQEMAERYAESVKTKPHNAYLERPSIRALVPKINGGRALDAGCGAGINLQWLLDQGAGEVVGVDVSPNMLAIAQRETSSDRISLHLADLTQPLDFLADDSFELVYSSLVVHYLQDLDALFAEFARLLHPGGHLVFSMHHPHEDHRLHGGAYFETRLVTETWTVGGEPVDVSFYCRPLSAITEALANAGFVIERMTEALPTEDYQRADPESYARRLENPSFLCVRARKE